MWDYLFDPNPNNFLSNKDSPCKLNYLHTRRSNAPSRSTLHCVGQVPPYVKHQLQPATPLHRVRGGTPIAKEHHCQISREPNINFTGAIAPFLRHWDDWAHCVFYIIGRIDIIEHHPHTRLSSGHDSDTVCCNEIDTLRYQLLGA